MRIDRLIPIAVVAAIVTLILLSACAPTYVAADQAADLAACRRPAPADGEPLIVVDRRGVSAPAADRRNAEADCMRARGWARR